MILAVVLVLLLLAGVFGLIRAGFRDGDVTGDTLVLDVEARSRPRGARATVSNPGREPVLVGLVLRRPGVRLRLDGGSYVKVRTAKISSELMPGRQATLGVVLPGEASSFVVPAPAGLGRKAELVAVVGQAGRLRTIHRMVRMSAPSQSTRWSSRLSASVNRRGTRASSPSSHSVTTTSSPGSGRHT